MKKALLFLLFLFSLALQASAAHTVRNVRLSFAKPTIASVDGKTSAVTITDDRDIVVVGKADPSRPVRLFRGTINLGQVNADPAGNYSISVSAINISDGTYQLSVQSVHTNGTLGEASDAFVLVVDRKPPTIGNVGGAVGGSTIRNSKPTLTGRLPVAGSVEIFETTTGSPKSFGIVKTDRSGNFTLNFETAFANGPHTLIARHIDAQGKLGNTSRPFTFTISPIMAKPSLVRINTKIIEANHTITINHLTVQVSSVTVGEKYQLFIDNVLEGESFFPQFVAAKPLKNGNYTLKVRLIGVDGVTSDFSDPVNLRVNASAAAITAVPTILSLNNQTQSPVSVGSFAKVIRIAGPAGAKVVVFSDGTPEPIGTFNAIGAYAANMLFPSGPTGSTAKVVAHVIDDLGNIGLPSNVFEVVRDNIPPQVPVITSIDGVDASPVKTNKIKPLIKGRAEAGTQLAILQLLGGNSVSFLGFIRADANGDFELNPYEYANKGLSNQGGENNIVVSSSDDAGNTTESDVFVVAHDQNAPDHSSATNSFKARIFTINGILPNQRNSITVNNLQVVVAAALGHKVQLFINNKLEGEQELKDTVVATFLKTNLPNGQYVLTAKAIDQQGKVSPFADPITVQLISLAPAITVAPQIVSYNGQTKSPIAVNATAKSLKITAPANAKLRVFYNAKKFELVKADANGVFEGVFPLNIFTNGTVVKVTAFIEDDFGNFGPFSNSLELLVDHVAPAAATISSVDGKTGTAVLTADHQPIIKGKAEANATVAVFSNNGANLLATIKADANGDFTLNASAYLNGMVLADGQQMVSAMATDEAGNVGPLGNAFLFTVDSRAPDAPVIVSIDGKTNTPLNSINNLPIVNGTAEANATITLFNGTTLLGTAIATAQGNWTFKPTTALAVGNYQLTAQAKDAAGNSSQKSLVFVLDIGPENPALSANNVLTPNGDGKNDYLVIKNIVFYPNNQLKVFDRAGQLVYAASNYKNDWDGRYNGSLLAEDTYYYSVTLPGQQTFKSFITIIRKSTK